MLVPVPNRRSQLALRSFQLATGGGIKKTGRVEQKDTIDGSTHMIHEHLFALPHEHAAQLYSFSTTP